MENHFKASTKPLFTFIQTMAAHWPYDVPTSREVECRAAAPAHIRRCTSTCAACRWRKIDYDYLLAELKRRFPDERFLIVHYGDHHPTATRTLLGFGEEHRRRGRDGAPGSPGLPTYYAVEALNCADALPRLDTSTWPIWAMSFSTPPACRCHLP